MALEILMPALSPTMTEGNLAKWLKKEGDKVKPGEVIAEIETDKATMEVESADSGILGRILIPAGTENVKVNQLIGVLMEEGDDNAAIESLITKHSKPAVQMHQIANTPPKKIEPEYTPAALVAVDDGKTEEIRAAQKQFVVSAGKVFSSPLARRIAATAGLDINSVVGTGPNGRVIKADVLSATSSQQKSLQKTFLVGRNASESYLEPLTQMRKVVAKRLLESKQTVPHFYLSIDCILTELSALRTLINNKARSANSEPEYKISVNDFIIKACAHALQAVPAANASWSDNGIVHYNNIDISVAVAITDGLITPIIKNADQKSLSQISIEMKNLAVRAKQNALRPEEFQGGGFSISNLGMYGIKEFKAIVNPPQACILAVGASEKRAVVAGDKIEIAEVMTLSLSCDHRVVDGALAAQLLTALRSFVENPSLMLV